VSPFQLVGEGTLKKPNMKQTIFLCLGLLLLCACTHTAKLQPTAIVAADTNTIRCLQVMNLSPEMNYLSQVTGFDTNYAHIYWRGNQLLYVMTHTHYIYPDSRTPLVRNKEKYIRRLALTQGSPYGAYYDEQNMTYNKKMPADSILKDSWVGGPKIFLHTAAINDTLVTSGQLPGSDTLRERWHFGVKAEPTVYGHVQLYFVPKRHGQPYSIDSATERAKGMTLCKLVTFIHSHTPGKNNVVEITMHNEYKEIPVTNVAELLPYFERQKRGEYSVQAADALKE
jgi:hypothetical protein